MENETLYYVYAKLDSDNRIVAINSNAFLDNVEDWVLIDSGTGDKYHHAQGNYLNTLINYNGAYIYELKDGKVVERDTDAIAADVEAAKKQTKPTLNERLGQLEEGFLAFRKLVGAFMGVKDDV